MAASPPDANAWTVERLLGWTREHFAQQELESPRLCAELLLAHAMGCRRIDLFTRYATAPERAALDVFRAHVRRAADGEPIAYLTGRKEFFSLDFEVSPAVLIPRPETEVLVERVVALVRSEPALRRIVDVGTGSGCIAIALARHLPGVELYASDISEPALAVARQNAERHGLSARIEFRLADGLAPWADRAPFDLIVSNPPYIAETEADTLPPTVRDYEPHVALFAGRDGLAMHRRLAADAPRMLSPRGHVLLEVAFDQASAVQALFDVASWDAPQCYRDSLGHARVVHACRRQSAAVAQVG